MAKKQNKPSGKSSRLDSEILNDALKFMDKGDLVELLYEEKGIKIQLKKKGAGGIAYAAPAAAPASAPQAAPPGDSKPQLEETANQSVVKSPMVGTFYRAPAPDAPPFVNVGDMVEPGKTLCIIEAMKIMNEIKAEVKGKVKEILAENAQAVEFNQPIILIEK